MRYFVFESGFIEYSAKVQQIIAKDLMKYVVEPVFAEYSIKPVFYHQV